MLKDNLGNDIGVEGQYLSIELDSPLHVVKGKLEFFEKGHVSTLAAPGKQGQITPTRIVVMVPVEIGLDPRAEVAMRISVLQRPPQEAAPAAPPAA